MNGAGSEEASRRVIAFAGGRGGIGRSLLALNVGVYLAQVGKRVVLVDADLGGASQHTLLGLDRPTMSLTQMIDRQADHLGELLIETPVPGLRLLSGAADRFGVANLRPTQKERLLQQLRSLDADFVLLDVGGGTSFNVLDFFLVADVGVLLALPEPSSVEAVYRFIKSVAIRAVRREVGRQSQWPQLIDDAVARLGGLPGPLELRDALAGQAAPVTELVEASRKAIRPRLVVNRTKVRSDLDLGPAMLTVVAHRLGVAMEYLGHVQSDDAVWLAARKRRPLMVESPNAQAASDIERIARRVLTPAGPDRAKAIARALTPVERLTHYELLQVDVGATEDEIRRGQRRMRDVYAKESLAGFSLIDAETADAMLGRIHVAYDALIDPAKRHQYDLRIQSSDGAREAAPSPPGEAEAAGSSPAPPPTLLEVEITAATEFDGPLLRRIRESRGVDLREVTARTKIGLGYLKAIEEEDFDALPALVYTTGFVRELAKHLNLDHRQVVKTYIQKLKKHLEEAGKRDADR